MDHPLPVDMKIANLEHRLAALRQRRDAMLWSGRVLKRAAWIAVAIAPFLIAYFAFTATTDPLPLAFLASGLTATVALVLWVYRSSTWIGDVSLTYGARNRYTSYWLFIEQAITEGERRLSELRSELRRSAGPSDPAS
jgi:hypothetical protein